MSRAEFIRFIGALREDSDLRDQFAEAQPEEILRLAKANGFTFSEEIQGRFLNRWAGVYFCPFANDIGELCPKLVRARSKTYSQTYLRSFCMTAVTCTRTLQGFRRAL